jgi:hypothetical protein
MTVSSTRTAKGWAACKKSRNSRGDGTITDGLVVTDKPARLFREENHCVYKGSEGTYRKKSFQEEFLALLDKHRIEYDLRYVFQ